jgi:polysaccharide export outer membrane protein
MHVPSLKPARLLYPMIGILLAPLSMALSQATLADLASRASMMKPMPGDRVILHVYGDPSLSDAATLDERGRIVLPRIGMVQADAYSIAALRDTIRSRMAAILKEPTIEVSVLRRIIVSGEVGKPGVYFADLTSSLGEMVAQSGGLRETGHPGKVYLVRGSVKTKIRDWQSNQTPAADLHSGDQILVGRKSWLELNIIPFASLSMAAVSLFVSLKRQL